MPYYGAGMLGALKGAFVKPAVLQKPQQLSYFSLFLRCAIKSVALTQGISEAL
jgi:hypothetical protein